MKMGRTFLLGIFLQAGLIYSALVPIPFITQPVEIQKFTRWEASKYMNRYLFSQCCGIDIVPMRYNPPGSIAYLTVISDEKWFRRLVFGFGIEREDRREGKWFKIYSNSGGSAGSFKKPLGVAIDDAVYQGNQNNYYVYVADKDANRIVRLIYNAIDSSLFYYDTINYSFLRPTDVVCANSPQGGSYLIADAGNCRIVIFRIYSNGSYVHLKNYGSNGSYFIS